MSFVFSGERATQAAACVLKRFQHPRLTRGKLIKLLYLADRRSISERGFPITGDSAFAIQDGPILTEIYDLIKGKSKKPKFQKTWSTFLESKGASVVLKGDPGNGKLSQDDVQMLASIVSEFGGMSFKQLTAYTHNLEEYKRSYQKDTSTKIPLDTIVEAVGRRSDLEHIERTKRFDQHLASLFGC
jgi:uncharacterized phage-associated protein